MKWLASVPGLVYSLMEGYLIKVNAGRIVNIYELNCGVKTTP